MSRKIVIDRIANFALLLAGPYAAVVLAQRWLMRDERMGQPAPAFDALEIPGAATGSASPAALDPRQVKVPPGDGKPAVVVFWATWCGPCRMELSRLKSAVEDGEIPADRIFAVSIGEPLEDVRKFSKEQDYPFRVIADVEGASSSLYGVRVTPTVVHVDTKGEMAWVSEGIHPLAVSRASRHLKE